MYTTVSAGLLCVSSFLSTEGSNTGPHAVPTTQGEIAFTREKIKASPHDTVETERGGSSAGSQNAASTKHAVIPEGGFGAMGEVDASPKANNTPVVSGGAHISAVGLETPPLRVGFVSKFFGDQVGGVARHCQLQLFCCCFFRRQHYM